MIKAVIPEENILEIPRSVTQNAPQKINTPSIFSNPVIGKLNSLEQQLLDILDQKNLSPEIKLKIYGNLLSSAISLNKFKKGRSLKNLHTHTNQEVQTDNNITNPLILNNNDPFQFLQKYKPPPNNIKKKNKRKKPNPSIRVKYPTRSNTRSRNFFAPNGIPQDRVYLDPSKSEDVYEDALVFLDQNTRSRHTSI